jgi:hypothetical protein
MTNAAATKMIKSGSSTDAKKSKTHADAFAQR